MFLVSQNIIKQMVVRRVH